MSARLSRCMPGPRATSVACVLSLMRAFFFSGGAGGCWGVGGEAGRRDSV